MADRRQYTGTQRLQMAWTVLTLAILGGSVQFPVGIEQPVVVTAVGIWWILGLVALGLRERRHWKRLVEQSSFEEGRGTRATDLEKLLGDRSVYVEANMPGPFSQTHTELMTRIEDVDASFTVTLTCVTSGGTTNGIQTGTDELDERFVIRGREGNVRRILSPAVQAALLDVETPGTCTITGKTVVYDVPFTRLSVEEVETIADAVVTLARQVEAVGEASQKNGPPP